MGLLILWALPLPHTISKQSTGRKDTEGQRRPPSSQLPGDGKVLAQAPPLCDTLAESRANRKSSSVVIYCFEKTRGPAAFVMPL